MGNCASREEEEKPVETDQKEVWTTIAFMNSVTQGWDHFVEGFIKQGTEDINQRDGTQNTLLMTAARRGHLNIVKMLLAAGAKTNLENYNYLTAADLAVENNHTEVVKVLVEAKTPFSRPTRNVYMSIGTHNNEILKILLQQGCDPDSKDCGGGVPFTYAHEQKNYPAMIILIEAGANIHKHNFIFIDMIVKKIYDVCSAMIYANINVNKIDWRGSSPLYYALQCQFDFEMISLLVLAGADPHDLCQDWDSPYELAKRNELDRVVALFESIPLPLQSTCLFHIKTKKNQTSKRQRIR